MRDGILFATPGDNRTCPQFSRLEAAFFSFHLPRMTISRFILTLGLLSLCPPPAAASASAWTETPGGRVRVIVEDGEAAKGEVRGALQIELAPGWKTYWRNPGDAGVPPQITVESGGDARLAYPAPMRFGEGEEGGIGYKAPVSLPITFRVEPGGARLKGHVFLGVCQNICIPVQAEFDLPLQDGGGPSAPQALAARTIVETAFDRLPAPASAGFGVNGVTRESGRAVFDLALPDPTAPAEFFVASDAIGLSEPVAGEKPGRFAVQLHGEAKAAVVDYTIVQNGKAVSGQVTLD